MMISANSPLEAWRAGCSHLLQQPGHQVFNLMLQFPCVPDSDEEDLSDYDPRRILGSKFDSARDVANTIFPTKTWKNVTDRPSLYSRYQRAHLRGRKRSWGTYFGRLISFGQSKANQLEGVIRALNDWPGNHRAALVLHTSSIETDKPRTRGGPCLQYVQIQCPTSKSVELLAIYRNHDYSNKVLGNFFGLSRLLRFIGSESGRTAGNISCVSAHAYFAATLQQQTSLMTGKT
jgi:thymidylate synthase